MKAIHCQSVQYKSMKEGWSAIQESIMNQKNSNVHGKEVCHLTIRTAMQDVTHTAEIDNQK